MAKTGRNVGWIRRWWLRGTLAGLVLCLLVGLVLWLMFQHIPSWYRPAELDRPGLRRAQVEATAMANWISERIIDSSPFEIILSERSVNEWLAALSYSYPDLQRLIPSGISRPAIRIEEDRVRFGAHYEVDGWEVIVGITAAVEMTSEGGPLTVRVFSISGGSLTAPDLVIERLLKPAFERIRDPSMRFHPSTASFVDAVRRSESIDELFEGIELRNQFYWPNVDRYFRILSIAATDGEVRITVEPL